MKFAIVSEHRNYFERYQKVELEGFFSQQQLEKFSLAVEGAISSRFSVPQDKFCHLTYDKQFKAGRDVWREDLAVKKWVTSSSLAEIASELTHVRPLRLCYDQFIPSRISPQIFLSNSEKTLETISCIQGVLCGIMVCLKGFCHPKEGSIFPSKAGNAIIFSSTKAIDFSELQTFPEDVCFLLITYSSKNSVYMRNDADTHVHEFKNLGYVFGDRLTDDINPIVYR